MKQNVFIPAQPGFYVLEFLGFEENEDGTDGDRPSVVRHDIVAWRIDAEDGSFAEPVIINSLPGGPHAFVLAPNGSVHEIGSIGTFDTYAEWEMSKSPHMKPPA